MTSINEQTAFSAMQSQVDRKLKGFTDDLLSKQQYMCEHHIGTK